MNAQSHAPLIADRSEGRVNLRLEVAWSSKVKDLPSCPDLWTAIQSCDHREFESLDVQTYDGLVPICNAYASSPLPTDRAFKMTIGYPWVCR